jgi:hypothetical protein
MCCFVLFSVLLVLCRRFWPCLYCCLSCLACQEYQPTFRMVRPAAIDCFLFCKPLAGRTFVDFIAMNENIPARGTCWSSYLFLFLFMLYYRSPAEQQDESYYQGGSKGLGVSLWWGVKVNIHRAKVTVNRVRVRVRRQDQTTARKGKARQDKERQVLSPTLTLTSGTSQSFFFSMSEV